MRASARKISQFKLVVSYSIYQKNILIAFNNYFKLGKKFCYVPILLKLISQVKY